MEITININILSVMICGVCGFLFLFLFFYICKKRYNEILFMADTCQAATLYRDFTAPNIIGVGSSKLGESSYSVE